jgi:hypothetical protein
VSAEEKLIETLRAELNTAESRAWSAAVEAHKPLVDASKKLFAALRESQQLAVGDKRIAYAAADLLTALDRVANGVYAERPEVHSDRCNVIHDLTADGCPDPCFHDWTSQPYSRSRMCPNCKSIVNMSGYGLSFAGWMGDAPARLSRLP